MPMLDQLEFIRPWWLLSLLPLLWVAWRVHSGVSASGSDWQKIMDPELYQALSNSELPANQPNRIHKVLSAAASVFVAVLLSVALAGPSWQTRELPVVERVTSRIMVLDLSMSMLAEDVKPNRLSRAKIKLREMLSRSADGQTGLIVFAGDAYAIAPLTEDVRTLDNLVPALEIGLMPSQGSRIDLALKLAGEMLVQTQADSGQIILLTDSPASQQAVKIANQLGQQGHRIDVLGFGTAKGAPIPNGEAGFVQKNGAIVFAKLEIESLRALATSAGGRFLQASGGNGDIAQLLAVNMQQEFKQSEQAASSVQRVDGGVFLILAGLPLLLLAMRGRGLFVIGMLLSASLLAPQSSYASDGWWDSLWSNNNQRAHQALLNGDAPAAVEGFDDPDWRAAADYQSGNFEAAADYWAEKNDATALFNRGNALARSGELEAALKAYQQALDLQPSFDDAEANASLLEDLLKQQQKQDSPQGGEGQEGETSDDGEKSEQSQEGQEGEQGEQGEKSQQGQSGQSGEQGQQQGQEGEPPEHAEEPAGDSAATQMSDEERQQMQQAGQQNDEQHESMEQAAQQLAEQMKDGEDSAEGTEQAFSDVESDEQPNDGMTERQALRRPDLKEQATDQWLNRIEDNPAGLLRRKFAYEADRRAAEQSRADDESGDPW